MRWLDKVERKLRWLSIPHLMDYIVFGMAAVFIADLMGFNFSANLLLSMPLVAKGEVWRLITFVFLPPSSSPIWVVFSLYFYWMIGSALANQWGSTRFTLFYLTGVVGNILAALLTGYAVNAYLNMALFFAFAAVWPDYEILLFFILPVKMKWLAIADALLFLFSFITGSWTIRAAIIASLLNVLLFIGGDLISRLRVDSRYWKTRWNYRRQMRR